MAVPASILPLVEKYTFHRDANLRAKGSDYNETQLRQDFTNPFFYALGCDMKNNNSHSEACREVLHDLYRLTEEEIKIIEGAGK
jgi:hypothetical protein